MNKTRLIKHLLGRLSALAEPMVEKRDHAMITKWARVVEEIGRGAVAHTMREAVHESIQAFCRIGVLSAKSGVDITNDVVDPLLKMERELRPSDRELIAEIEYAKREIEESTRKYVTVGTQEPGIQTSDLW